jgi:hypothetical protein
VESVKQKQKLMHSLLMRCDAMQVMEVEQQDAMQLLCTISRTHLVADDLRYNFSIRPATSQLQVAVEAAVTRVLAVWVAAWSEVTQPLRAVVLKLLAAPETHMMQTRWQVFSLLEGLQARTTKAAAVAAVGMAAAAVRVIEEAVAGQVTSHFSQMHPLRPG